MPSLAVSIAHVFLLLHVLLLTCFQLISARPAASSLCSAKPSAALCTADASCRWSSFASCCHSSLVCTQDVASLTCSAGCRPCGNRGCFANADMCPVTCESLTDASTCNAQKPAATGTKCAWNANTGSCGTTVPLDQSSLDPGFASAAAGIIERTRQAMMVANNGKSSSSTSSQSAFVPADLAPGPADASSNGSGVPAATSVVPSDPTHPSDPWASSMLVRGTKVTAPVIAGIVIGCIAAVGIAAVVIHRTISKRRALAQTTANASLPPAAAQADGVRVDHHRQSLLGWLQHVTQDAQAIPPPTPMHPSPIR